MSAAMSRRIRAIFNTFNFWTLVLYNIVVLNSVDFAKLVAKRLLLKGTLVSSSLCYAVGVQDILNVGVVLPRLPLHHHGRHVHHLLPDSGDQGAGEGTGPAGWPWPPSSCSSCSSCSSFSCYSLCNHPQPCPIHTHCCSANRSVQQENRVVDWSRTGVRQKAVTSNGLSWLSPGFVCIALMGGTNGYRKEVPVYGLLHRLYLLFTSGTTSKMDGYSQSGLKTCS